MYPLLTSPIPRIQTATGRMIDTPSPEWVDNHLLWRWLLDTLEGGKVYRDAIYGHANGCPVRNLIRHKSEYPAPGESAVHLPGADPASNANVDDYEMRRARTPVPTFFAEVADAHLDAIFEQEVDRDGPADLEAFWGDVDGRGTDIGEWWGETAARLLLTLGNLDVIAEPPPVPDGVEIRTRRDAADYGIDRVRVSYILPENVLWWLLSPLGEYAEVLIREVQDDGTSRYRYWTLETWQLFDADGHPIGQPVEHGYGIIPIVRLFDDRRPRCKHVGLPRYEPIAELTREYYNRDSELVLSDSTAAHPLFQGPDDYVMPDNTIAIGPNRLLPMKGNEAGGGGKSYQGFEYVDPPKGAAASIRENLQSMRDAVDRAARLTKPAGASGTSGNTVSQSGVSKLLDETSGTRLLGKLAKMLARNESVIARLVLRVLRGPQSAPIGPADVRIAYPSRFNLVDATGQLDALGRFQIVSNAAGVLPEIEAAALKRISRELIKGLSEDDYRKFDAEIDAFMAAQSAKPEPEPPIPQNTPSGLTIDQDDADDDASL